jgi:putative tricarboxylic transport membrane protein
LSGNSIPSFEKEDLMSLFWFVLALLICYGSYRMDIGTPSSPGPGFIPFLSALVMAASSLSILIMGILKKLKKPKPEGSAWSLQGIREVGLLVFSLIGFMSLLNLLGFALSSLLFMAFLLKVVGYQKWNTVILGSLFTSVGAFLLFQWILKCQLPTGITGF